MTRRQHSAWFDDWGAAVRVADIANQATNARNNAVETSGGSL